jgi:hypothetical protein
MMLETVVEQALNLSPLEKIRLVERLMHSLERDIAPSDKPRQDLYGIWSDVRVSDDDIDQVRQQMWGNFPREDVS